MGTNTGKFLNINSASGRIEQIAGLAASAGAADAGKVPVTDASGRFDSTLMPAGFGQDSVSGIIASEALAAGALVDIWNNAGTLNARNASAAASGKEADGFVLAAVAQGATATVIFEGQVAGLAGLTPGGRCYVSAATAGAVTQVPPSASGNVVQFIGVATSATSLSFEADDGIILA